MQEEDAEIGNLALEKGLVPQQAMDECLSLLGEDPSATLTGIFVKRGFLKAEQVESLRAEARRRLQGRRTPVPGADAAAAAGVPSEVAVAASHAANRFGKFVRVAVVGEGSLGNVWKAWDTEQRRWVALKVLQGSVESEETLQSLKEANAAISLKHPGIVSVYEAGCTMEGDAERAYVAVEFTEGETAECARERDLPSRRVAEIVHEAAVAVAAAHDKGVFHRNLKPRNVIVMPDGHVRVTDFGLAAPVATMSPSEDQMLSRTFVVRGTPGYLAPEQATGRTHDIRERTDVYALGAVLYFLITGRPPFDAGGAIRTCFAVIRDPLVPPRQLRPDVPRDLDRVVMRAMAKDPVRRYSSARALAEDLDRFLQGMPILTDDQLRFTQGMSALHAGRLEEAIHMFREMLRLESEPATTRMGREEVFKGIEEGEKGLTLAIGRQGKNYDIRTQRGVYRFAKAILRSLEGADPSGDCKKSMEDFLTAAELRPEFTPARVNRANVLLFGGRWARDSGKDVLGAFRMALQDLDAAVRFDDTCSAAYQNRGIVHFYMARDARRRQEDPEPAYRQAIADFSRAAELEQTNAYVFKDLGVVKVALAKHLLTLGQKVKTLFEEAVAHLDIACRLDGALYGAFYERGQAHFALKQFKDAIRDFQRCLELDPLRGVKVHEMLREAENRLGPK